MPWLFFSKRQWTAGEGLRPCAAGGMLRRGNTLAAYGEPDPPRKESGTWHAGSTPTGGRSRRDGAAHDSWPSTADPRLSMACRSCPRRSWLPTAGLIPYGSVLVRTGADLMPAEGTGGRRMILCLRAAYRIARCRSGTACGGVPDLQRHVWALRRMARLPQRAGLPTTGPEPVFGCFARTWLNLSSMACSACLWPAQAV